MLSTEYYNIDLMKYNIMQLIDNEIYTRGQILDYFKLF